MGDHVSIVREAKMPLGLLARVGLTRTCPEAGRWTGRAQDTLPDSQGSALCRALGAPGPRASAGNASKRRNPDRVRGGRSNRKPREQQGPWGRTPPHHGVELGSHPHECCPLPGGVRPREPLCLAPPGTPQLGSPPPPVRHTGPQSRRPRLEARHTCAQCPWPWPARAGGWQQREPPRLSSAGPAPRKGPESRQEGLTWGTAALGRVACTVGTCTSCPQDPLVWMLVVTYKVSLSCPLGKSFTRGRWPFPQPGPP